MSKNQEIRDLFSNVKRKTTAHEAISKAVGWTRPYTKNILTDSGFWAVPEKHEDKVLKALREVIEIEQQPVKEK